MLYPPPFNLLYINLLGGGIPHRFGKKSHRFGFKFTLYSPQIRKEIPLIFVFCGFLCFLSKKGVFFFKRPTFIFLFEGLYVYLRRQNYKNMKKIGKKKNNDIIIDTPNKDVIASYIFALSQKKDVSMIEQRAVLRLIEYAQDHGLRGLSMKDNLRQINLALDKVVLTIPITDIAFFHAKPEEVENALRNLRSRAFVYRYKDKKTGHSISLIAGLLDRAEIEFGKGLVTMYVDNQVWGMMTNFSLGFREFELNKALALPTAYSLQFYMMITGQKRPFFMSIEEFREWLGIDEDKYRTKEGKDRIDHMEERIILPSKKALDETCPYSFTYTKIRQNPKNCRSTVIGFNFCPVQKPENRDPELEKGKLLSQLHSSTFITKNIKDILRDKVGMSQKEMDSHISLWEDVNKYLVDPLKTITTIYDRSRAKGPKNPVGYLISALKREVDAAKKEKAKEEATEAEKMVIVDMNDGKSMMDVIQQKPSKKKVSFTVEQIQSMYSQCEFDIPMEEWVKGLGYFWDEENKVYFK